MNELVTTMRNKILAFEAWLRALEAPEPTEDNYPVTHHFAPGSYGREIFIPQGHVVVGKIHKHAHLNVLSQGRVAVLTEQGVEEFQAPRTWVSVPGTKRVVFAHTDVVWTTIHVTPETDLTKIEEHVIAKDYDALAQFLAQQKEQLT
ncbi:MAG: hypothetical protein KGL39_18765 [Patescibacteria group bacterium]|nr:hypothetical protein [Patescibacteria group bacterium]